MAEIIELGGAVQHRLTLDPSRWSYEDYAQFLDALMRSDWESVMPRVMDITVAWTYDVPLSPDAYLELSYAELGPIVLSVKETLEAFVDGLNAADAQVDLRYWNMSDNFAFKSAARAGNVAEMERYMKMVTMLDGVRADRRLTFEQGALIAKGITEAQKDMFGAGKSQKQSTSLSSTTRS